jgi:hypothetical protein
LGKTPKKFCSDNKQNIFLEKHSLLQNLKTKKFSKGEKTVLTVWSTYFLPTKKKGFAVEKEKQRSVLF